MACAFVILLCYKLVIKKKKTEFIEGMKGKIDKILYGHE